MPKNIYQISGAIGGRSKTLKGMAKIAKEDPVRFSEIIKNRKPRKKTIDNRLI